MTSFSAAVVASVAAAAGISSSYVSIASINSGSVVVAVQINLPSSLYSATQASALTTLVTSSPSTTFSSSFCSTYGVSANTISGSTTASSSPSSDSPVLSTGAIIGIAVGGGVGLILLIVLLVLVLRRGERHHWTLGLPIFHTTPHCCAHCYADAILC